VKILYATTQFFKADFLIFPVSAAPSNNGSRYSTSSLLKNLRRSSASMNLQANAK